MQSKHVDLHAIWTWGDDRVPESMRSGAGRDLMQEARRIQDSFARNNPGFTLNVSPPRSLARQVQLWVASSSVKTAGEQLFRATAQHLADPKFDLPATMATVRAAAFWIRVKDVFPEPGNAAPGTSDHAFEGHSARPMSHGTGASVNSMMHSNVSRPSPLLVALGLASVIECARHEADKASVDTPAPITEQAPPGISPVARGVAKAAPPEPAQAGIQKPDESFLQPVGMPMSPSMAVAERWMQSLRDQNESALAQSTKYPFEWRSTAEQGCSAKQPATTVEEFSSVIGCVLGTAPLTRVLVEHDRAGIVELPIGRLQPWAQVWRQDVPPRRYPGKRIHRPQ